MVENIMLGLIKSAISNKDFVVDGLDEKNLKELFLLSKAHDVAHIIAAQLEQRNLLIDEAAKQKFFKEKMLGVYRREQLDFEEEKVVSVLEEENIDYILLKGSVLKNYYPQKWMRLGSDNDILIKEPFCDKAITSICNKLGYDYLGHSLHDHQFKSKNGVHLELHFSILGNNKDLDEFFKNVWDYAVPIGKNRFEFTPEFLIFHIVSHAQYHFVAGGCGIKPFMDYFVINQNLKYDENKLLSLFEQGKNLKFFKEFSNLAQVWFGDKQHSELTEMMEKYILSGGVYGTVENYGSAQAHRHGGRFKHFIKRIFKPKIQLEAQYPNLKKRPYLLPFYQIKRWFGLFNKKKRKEVFAEVEGSGNTKQISVLLDKLEL